MVLLYSITVFLHLKGHSGMTFAYPTVSRTVLLYASNTSAYSWRISAKVGFSTDSTTAIKSSFILLGSLQKLYNNFYILYHIKY